MNTLTWLIYASGLMEKLGPLLAIGAALWACSLLITLVCTSDMYNYEKEKAIATASKYLGRIAAVWFILLVVFIVVPDKETALFMASSEVVSRGATTEIGVEIQKSIVHQLKEYRKEK